MSRVRVPDGAPFLLSHRALSLCGPLVKWPKTPASHAGNTSSNLVRVTILILYVFTNAYLAQSVEHAAVNRRVVGSSPTIGAIELVLIAARVHPFPYRTRKLSSHGAYDTWREAARENK